METTITAEPTGHAAGRVTITGAFVGLIPPIVTVILVAGCFLIGILTAEIAMAVILGVLVNAGLTTTTVFTAQKRTPTDQLRTQTVIQEIEVPVAAPTAGHDFGMVPDVDVTHVDQEALEGSHAAAASPATLRAELAARGL